MGTGGSDGAGAGATDTLMALRVPSGAICETPENVLRVPGRPAKGVTCSQGRTPEPELSPLLGDTM